MASTAMSNIYGRLKPLGFDRRFIVECVLPDWWEDALAETPSNRTYAEAVISRQLGLDLASVHDSNAAIVMRETSNLRYKLRQGVKENDLPACRSIGTRLASIASDITIAELRLEDSEASSVRSTILEAGTHWVGFKELLTFCWGIGIPVIQLNRIPSGKMDGMVVQTEDRPVIVIASHRKQPAWHLFILAHELGHIAKGHLEPGDVGVDSKVRFDASDVEEREANAFAKELLSGNPNIEYTSDKRLTAEQLAKLAFAKGTAQKIDPGFIILNYARNRGFYGVGEAALKILYPNAEASSFYNQFYGFLDTEDLTEDSNRFLKSLTEAA